MTLPNQSLGKWRIKPATYNPERDDNPDFRQRLLERYAYLKSKQLLLGHRLYVDGHVFNTIQASVVTAKNIQEARRSARKIDPDDHSPLFLQHHRRDIEIIARETAEGIEFAGPWETVLDLVTDSKYWLEGLECIAKRECSSIYMGEMYIDTPAKLLLKIFPES